MSSPKKLTNAVTQILPKGWKRRIYLRTNGASAGRKDVHLISPDNFILRSNVEVERYAKSNKVKLDPKVYTVSLSSVENIFKRESEMILAKLKTSVSLPGNQNENKTSKVVLRKRGTKRSSVLTETAPSNLIKKSVGRDDALRKRGRPSKDTSILMAKKIVRHSFTLRRKSATPAKVETRSKVEPATKRRRSGDSGTGREGKRGKFEDAAPVFVATGRQTRNSISTVDIPILSPKIKRHQSMSPEKGNKVVCSIQPSNARKGSLRLANKKTDALEDSLTEESNGEETEDTGTNQRESMKDDDLDSLDLPLCPMAENIMSEQEVIDPPNVEQVHDIEDRVLEDADGGSETEVEDCEENCEDPRHLASTSKGGVKNKDDYDVPMDDVEMSFQAPTDPTLKTDLPEILEPTEESVPLIAEEVEVQNDEEPEEEEMAVEEQKESEDEDIDREKEKEREIEGEEEMANEEQIESEDEDIDREKEEDKVELQQEQKAVVGEEETGFKVVNSKDLDKIDLNNFKFFVLPEDDDELPGDEVLPQDWSTNLADSQVIIMPVGDVKDFASAISKAVAEKKMEIQELKTEAEDSRITPDEDLDVSDDEEEDTSVAVDLETQSDNRPADEDEAENIEAISDYAAVEEIGEEPSIDQSTQEPAVKELTKDPVEEDSAVKTAVESIVEDSFLLSQSPYVLIYEHPSIGGDPWRLLLAAMVSGNETAQVGPVLTQKLLQRFPDANSILLFEDILGLPECEFVPKLPWLVRRLQKVARRLLDGAQVEDLSDDVGNYAVDVWRVFGKGQLDIVTKEFDLLAYLEWRRSLQV